MNYRCLFTAITRLPRLSVYIVSSVVCRLCNMSLQTESSVLNPNYTFVSRWMHKTLEDWRIVLKENGSKVLIYEEYIDFTMNKHYFEKFVQILGEYCPNLRHARLLFSGDKNDEPEDGIVESLLRLPNLQCLCLFDAPKITLLELKSEHNQLTTLKLAGVDDQITTECLAEIFGTMKNLHSLVYHYKEQGNKFAAATINLPKLKALTLHYLPTSELIPLRNCNQLKVLQLYNIYDKISSEDFLDIFKQKSKLKTLFINLLYENTYLAEDFHKLDAYCPQLTNLTLVNSLDNFGDFKNLKYLNLDMDDNNLDPLEMEELLNKLCPKYADRLQILDISRSPKHTHSMEITKLKLLKAFLCFSWPSNMYKCLSEFSDLRFLAFETFADESGDIKALINLIETCSKLQYLRLPLKTVGIEELILALPDILHRRGFQPKNPFVLSLVGGKADSEIAEKLKALPHGNLLQLDGNAQVFTSKLKDLIATLDSTKEKTTTNAIYQNPCKMAGDRMEPEDFWLSNMNYKTSLKSCTNKFNLEYDEMILHRCRDMNIKNAVYELTNMQFAFNFKYHALDEHNECYN